MGERPARIHRWESGWFRPGTIWCDRIPGRVLRPQVRFVPWVRAGRGLPSRRRIGSNSIPFCRMLQIPGEGLACGRVFGVVFSAFLRWMKADDGGMFSAIRSVHFVGVGGTAMASVAAAMQQMGMRSPVPTRTCIRRCRPFWSRVASRSVGYAAENLDGKPDLVVIGNALSRGNAEVETVLDRKLRYVSLPELLKEFFYAGAGRWWWRGRTARRRRLPYWPGSLSGAG
jgi:hypothetical protein